MMDGAEGQVPSGARAHLADGDVVRAAGKFLTLRGREARCHGRLDATLPANLQAQGRAAGKATSAEQGRKVTETPFQGTALQGPSEWQRRVMQASTSKASAVQQLSTTTETPAEASQGFSHGLHLPMLRKTNAPWRKKSSIGR